MTTKQELKDRLAARTNEVVELRREVNSLNRLLTDAQSAECRAITERDELRAQLAARQADAPEPRPFRVGDRVRVAEGATFQNVYREATPATSAGRAGKVVEVHPDGDLFLGVFGGYVSPEFCTLIEPEPEPTTPAPSVRVRVTYLDAPEARFDADEIEVMEPAPVYALLKDGAVVACVPVAGVRSVEVVR